MAYYNNSVLYSGIISFFYFGIIYIMVLFILSPYLYYGLIHIITLFILCSYLYSKELFSLFDDLRVEKPQSEQINDPSNPDQYWRYRMHINIEELCKHEELKSTIKAIARQSGRV
jgi:4-alpha-glucanotransferase